MPCLLLLFACLAASSVQACLTCRSSLLMERCRLAAHPVGQQQQQQPAHPRQRPARQPSSRGGTFCPIHTDIEGGSGARALSCGLCSSVRCCRLYVRHGLRHSSPQYCRVSTVQGTCTASEWLWQARTVQQTSCAASVLVPFGIVAHSSVVAGSELKRVCCGLDSPPPPGVLSSSSSVRL